MMKFSAKKENVYIAILFFGITVFLLAAAVCVHGFYSYRQDVQEMERMGLEEIWIAIESDSVEYPAIDDVLGYFRPFSGLNGATVSKVIKLEVLAADISNGQGYMTVRTKRVHYNTDGSMATFPNGSPEIVSDKAEVHLRKEDGRWSIVDISSSP